MTDVHRPGALRAAADAGREHRIMETDKLEFSKPEQAWTDLTHRGKLMDAMLHPAAVFARPADVLAQAALSEQERRTILTAWARDALGVESVAPGLAQELAAGARLDEVIEALRSCDPAAAANYSGAAAYLRGERRRQRAETGRRAAPAPAI